MDNIGTSTGFFNFSGINVSSNFAGSLYPAAEIKFENGLFRPIEINVSVKVQWGLIQENIYPQNNISCWLQYSNESPTNIRLVTTNLNPPNGDSDFSNVSRYHIGVNQYTNYPNIETPLKKLDIHLDVPQSVLVNTTATAGDPIEIIVYYYMKYLY